MAKISAVKGEYIVELLSKGIRDGPRKFMDYRKITISQGLLPNAEGSAQVDLGNTKVLVGIKMGVGEPMPDKPKEGNLMVNAELLPLASADYDAGPPSPESVEFARVVDRGIRAAGTIDLSSLFIEKDKVWRIFVDIYVLNYDGNLFDAGTLAVMAALLNTKMPRYENDAVVREGEMPKLKIGSIVTSCTYAKLGDKIIIDPTGAEESVMDARLTVTNDEQYIRAMQKGLNGAFSYAEIENLLEKTFEKSKELRKVLEGLKG